MSQQGATLQSYNNELVKCIEDLCTRRDEIQKQIIEEEDEKNKLQNDLRILTERLARVNESLSRKIASRAEFDKTIAETEAAYTKILESSQTLLNVLKSTSRGGTASRTGVTQLPTTTQVPNYSRTNTTTLASNRLALS